MTDPREGYQPAISIRLYFPQRTLDLRDFAMVFTKLDSLYGFSVATAFVLASERHYIEEQFHHPWSLLSFDDVQEGAPRPDVWRVQHESPLAIELVNTGSELVRDVAPYYILYRLARYGIANVEQFVSFPWRTVDAWYQWRIKAEQAKREWRELTGTAGTPEVEQSGLDDETSE